MASQSLTFDAVAAARPGPKWCARWHVHAAGVEKGDAPPAAAMVCCSWRI